MFHNIYYDDTDYQLFDARPYKIRLLKSLSNKE